MADPKQFCENTSSIEPFFSVDSDSEAKVRPFRLNNVDNDDGQGSHARASHASQGNKLPGGLLCRSNGQPKMLCGLSDLARYNV